MKIKLIYLYHTIKVNKKNIFTDTNIKNSLLKKKQISIILYVLCNM